MSADPKPSHCTWAQCAPQRWSRWSNLHCYGSWRTAPILLVWFFFLLVRVHGLYQPRHHHGTNLPTPEELFPDAHQRWWGEKQVGYQADTVTILIDKSVQVWELCSMSILSHCNFITLNNAWIFFLSLSAHTEAYTLSTLSQVTNRHEALTKMSLISWRYEKIHCLLLWDQRRSFLARTIRPRQESQQSQLPPSPSGITGKLFQQEGSLHPAKLPAICSIHQFTVF